MLTGTLLALLFTFFSAMSSFAADSRPAWRVEWDRTVAAAEKEGALSLYIFEAGPLTEDTVQAFERAYPKIKVSQLRGRGNDLGPRLIAEKRAGKHIADMFAGGKGTAFTTLYAGKLLDPLKPLLFHPEVIDESKWYRGELKYVDPENKYVFAYIGNAGGVEINYNTNLVNGREFASYWDLTQPKWKGKIVATDPRSRGMDNPVLFFYYHPKLGPEFIRKLYGDMEVAVAREYRQPVDWLASGRYAVCIPCVSDEMDKAMDQGLPVAQQLRLKEGGTLSSSGGTLSLLQHAPHPNAAKLFVDFMLSEEGQKIIASFGRVPTRRGTPTTVQGLEKLNFVIDEFSAGDDFNKNYEQFRNIFGTTKP